MPPDTQSRALVPYGFWEKSVLHPVQLAPIRRRRKRWPAFLALLALLLMAAVTAGYTLYFSLSGNHFSL